MDSLEAVHHKNVQHIARCTTIERAVRRPNRLLHQALQKRWIDPVNLEEQLQSFAKDSKEIIEEAMHRNRKMTCFERIPAIQWFMRNEQVPQARCGIMSGYVRMNLLVAQRAGSATLVEPRDCLLNRLLLSRQSRGSRSSSASGSTRC